MIADKEFYIGFQVGRGFFKVDSDGLKRPLLKEIMGKKFWKWLCQKLHFEGILARQLFLL